METLLRIIRLGNTNFWRNRWLTLGATLLMTLTLTMISLSLLISFVIKDSSEAVRSKINLTVYFRDDAIKDEVITRLADRIKTLNSVQEVDFIDKARTLEIWRRLPINAEIKQPVNENFNPLPRSLEINIDQPEAIKAVADAVSSVDQDKIICSDCISYTNNQRVVDQLVNGTKSAQRAGWLLSILFGLIAVFNVYNIIRLAIIARSDEIEIMRYVGASNAFIRGPFIVEGIFYGVFATLASTLFIYLLTVIVSSYGASGGIGLLNGAFGLIGSNLKDYVLDHLKVLVTVQLAVGVVLGILVSTVSIRKYLKI